MDINERLKLARKVLGRKIHIKTKTDAKKNRKAKKVSSFIQMAVGDKNTSPGKIYRQCGKKKRYRSEHEARLIANRGEAARGTKLRVYACPLCGGYHITSQNFRSY